MSLFSHEFHEDSSDEFGTPGEFHRPIADAVGGFDLDPAAGAEDSPLASTRYTKEDDGLSKEWFGTVWLNPPFSEKETWLRRAVAEVNAGRVGLAVVLLPVDTSTQWFHEYAATADALCFIEGRLSFVGGDRNPNFGVMIAAFGDVPHDLLDVLDRKGVVFQGPDRHQRHEQETLLSDGGDCNRRDVDTDTDRSNKSMEGSE
jgi:phage N-6-adenine-methyltransferase